MTKKGYSVLFSLIENHKIKNISFICIGKDTKLDNDYSLDIENLCKRNRIVFFYKDEIHNYSIICDYYLAISWRWLIDLPNLIILHDSILPKYRGFAPLVNMLINGEELIGVTAIFASKDYDKGDIILQKKIRIDYPIKIKNAIDIISGLYSEISYDIFSFIENNKKLVGVKQTENDASYSLWLNDEDYFINWKDEANKIRRKIDACGSPYQGAKCFLNDKIIIITEAVVLEDVMIENRVCGKIIFINNNFPVVVCGTGLLMIKEAVYQETLKNILPLNKFRSKLR